MTELQGQLDILEEIMSIQTPDPDEEEAWEDDENDHEVEAVPTVEPAHED